VRSLALADPRTRGLEIDLALTQLLLQSVEGLAAQLLGLSPAVELRLARGDGLLQQRRPVVARLELRELLGSRRQLLLEIAAHLLALLRRCLELGTQAGALGLQACHLRLEAGTRRMRGIALPTHLLQLGTALVESRA
jgi:hypothetical protein